MKIITFGEKSWTNLPFHYIVPSHSTALKDGVSGRKVIDFQLLLTAGSDSTTAWIETHTYYFLSKLEVKWHILLHYLVQKKNILEWSKKYLRMAPTNISFLDTTQEVTNCKSYFVGKVHIFWEGHKIWRYLHLIFDWHRTKVRWIFHKILWPS